MASTPKPIHDAAAAFDRLPGVGPRAALRYAYHLAAQSKNELKSFARALDALAEGVQICPVCGIWTDVDGCQICNDPRRDATQICVVGTSQDVRVIEDSGAFKGRYHVLGGLIDPISGRTPETLNIAKLIARVRDASPAIVEVILALDPDVSGDTTAMYLNKQLSPFPVLVTRLGRGMQNGAQIEYADGTTIANALQNRKSA